MRIVVYKITDDYRKLQKTFTSSYINYDCELLHPCSIYEPTFILNSRENLFAVNYCYVPRFERYYFVTNITTDNGGRIIFNAKCDVLMSFATQIRALRGVHVVRKNDKPTYTIDTRLPMTPNKTMETIKLKTGAFDAGVFNLKTADSNSYNYILTVSGGGTNDS